MYLSLFGLSAHKEILPIKQQLYLNCASPQNSHHSLGQELGDYTEKGDWSRSSLFCTSRKPTIPRLGQLEQSESNAGILEEAEHKAAGGGPWRGTLLGLPQIWDAGVKPSPHLRSPAWLTGCWVFEMDAKYNVFFSSAVHASHLVKWPGSSPLNPALKEPPFSLVFFFLKTLPSYPLALFKYWLPFSFTSLKLVNVSYFCCCLMQALIVKFRKPCVVITK